MAHMIVHKWIQSVVKTHLHRVSAGDSTDTGMQDIVIVEANTLDMQDYIPGVLIYVDTASLIKIVNCVPDGRQIAFCIKEQLLCLSNTVPRNEVVFSPERFPPTCAQAH